jgi:uncharacterized phage-associated protein
MFTETKAAQMAAYLLYRSGGAMPRVKLMKLMYLADRRCFELYDSSMSDDDAVSMEYGPALSKTYSLMRVPTQVWSKYILNGEGDEHIPAAPIEPAELGKLSRADLMILDDVHCRHGNKTPAEIVDYTHTLPEWRDPAGETRSILKALGKTPDVIEEILEEMEEDRNMDAALASACS